MCDPADQLLRKLVAPRDDSWSSATTRSYVSCLLLIRYRSSPPFDGSTHFELTDDPRLPGGLGSRLYDGEGLAAKRRSGMTAAF